jgi:hypothetical protein
VFDTLLETPALDPVTGLLGVERLLNSVLERPIVLTTLDPVLQTLPPIVEPVLNPLAPLSDVIGGVLPRESSLAPVIDLVTPVLDDGEKLAPPVPGATPRAPENPVPAPNSPAVPAKPSANPALPSSSAPADDPERATVAAPAIPQPTPFSVPVLGLRTAGADAVPATSADRATAGSIAGIAFSDNAAVFEPLDVAGTDAISASSRAQSGWPAQLYSGSAFASAAAGLSSFASSASAVAVLAMAIAAGALALSSRRVNLEWPVPPAMAWAPEIPPAR